MFRISFEEFVQKCLSHQRYTGYVEGLGYVYWKPYHLLYDKREEMSIDSTPHPSHYTIDFYELMIIRESKDSDAKIEQLKRIKDIASDALSYYGAINSVQQLSNKPVIIGPDYIQINRQGTLVRNRNKKITTKGKIAGRIGNKLTVAGIFLDGITWVWGNKEEKQEAAVNIAVNVGLYAIGAVCPPAGAVLGILWFILTTFRTDPRASQGSYEQIHGSITPADATNVYLPHFPSANKIKKKEYGF